MSIFELTEKFNKEIIGINRQLGTIEDDKEFHWMIGTILEELEEFNDAHEKGDFIAEIDSVLDLLYFASGFLTRMGVSSELSEKLFRVVHECNMNKSRGKKERETMHELDAIKPKGWVSPEERIMEILDENNN